MKKFRSRRFPDVLNKAILLGEPGKSILKLTKSIQRNEMCVITQMTFTGRFVPLIANVTSIRTQHCISNCHINTNATVYFKLSHRYGETLY